MLDRMLFDEELLHVQKGSVKGGGEPPAVCLLAGVEAADTEDDAGSVWVIGDSVSIRNHSSVAHEGRIQTNRNLAGRELKLVELLVGRVREHRLFVP